MDAAEFLLPSDAAHLLALTPAAVKLAVRAGRLRVAAKTMRGVHLFRLEDIEAFRKARAAGQAPLSADPAIHTEGDVPSVARRQDG